MKEKDLLKMNLQYFAEDPKGGEGDDPNNQKDEGGEGSNDKQPKDEQPKDDPVEFTEEQQKALENIISDRLARQAKKYEKEIDEAKEYEKLSDDEKVQADLKKLQEENEEYKRQENLREMSKVAQEKLEGEGVTEFGDLLEYVVADDAETTKERVDDLAKALKARDEKIKEELQKQLGTRTILGGNDTAGLSLGEQMAKEANQQNKPTDNDPWKIN
jgi:hypothetical protein